MPLVPRFLRPAPPVRVDDTWPAIDSIRARGDSVRTRSFTADELRAISAEVRALPDPTPPDDECDQRPVEQADQRSSTPEPEDEQPCEAPAWVDAEAAENAQADRVVAPRAPAPSPDRIENLAAARSAAPRRVEAYAQLPAPVDDRERAALRGQARAMPDEAPFLCDTLRLARLCPHAKCRKANRCRGHPRICLDTTGESVPAEVFEWAVRIAEARQDGEPLEDIEAMYPEEALAYRCWTAALDARVRR
jgi:hypothetical protein